MRPQVQYARSVDGTSIAYCVQGEGTPLLHLQPLLSHLERAEEVSTNRVQFAWLAARFRLIRTDYRGTGLSQRGVVPRSLDLTVQDLEAVLARAGAERCIVFGHGPSTLYALALAHRFPARVSRLVLYNAYLTGGLLWTLPGIAELLPVADRDWEMFSEMVANILYGWSAETARAAAAVFRAAATREEFHAHRTALEAIDLSGIVSEITAPTLIVYPRDGYVTDPEAHRRVAAMLPDARLVTISGRFVAQGFDDPEMTGPVAEFLGVPAGPAPPTGPAQDTVVILFADIAESTALTERLGDAPFRARARELDVALRRIVREAGGAPVEGKLLGDGVLAVFTSARGAIEAALGCGRAGAAAGLGLHLGIHAGDVIRDGDNVYGGAVNVAARVAAASTPGEVLVSDTVRGLARTSAEVAFADRGEHELRGIAERLRLFAVTAR